MAVLKYISSLLGFVQSNNTTTSLPAEVGLGSSNTSSGATCRGWSRPDPAVRLRQSNNDGVRIFGFPRPEDLPDTMETPLPGFGNGGPLLLYLPGQIPAYVSYVMGDGWIERLQNDHHTSDQRNFHDGSVILRPGAPYSTWEDTTPDENAAEERAHCLRMRRCGAVAICSEADAIMHDQGYVLRHPWLPLFGWPSSGGVWVLRYPESDPDDDERLDRRMLMDGSDNVFYADLNFLQVKDKLKGLTDMDKLCRVLEDAGAEFYPGIGDCPEVARLALDET